MSKRVQSHISGIPEYKRTSSGSEGLEDRGLDPVVPVFSYVLSQPRLADLG